MIQITVDQVVRLGDTAGHQPRLAGNKAATLSRLLAEGFPVPSGFVVTVSGAEALLDPNAPAHEMAVSATKAALASLGDVPVAVRSSGRAEDLEGASFAGQYETVLGVHGLDGVIDAVRRCVSSAGSERVARYGGAHAAQAGMAVLVQRMVSAEAAGVAFTANPVTGDPEVVVNAAPGLGEHLVAGEITPDQWVVSGGQATCRSNLHDAVTAAQVMEIADLATRAAASLGMPQDVEWSIADGKVLLLQARPITALPQAPELDIPTEGYWTKDTFHYPTPLTPFGASVYLPALDAAFPAMVERYGFLFEGATQISLGGETYMRLIPMGGRDRTPPPWWVLWVVARIIPALRRKERTAREVIDTDVVDRLVAQWHEEWRPYFVAEASRLRDRDLASLNDAELLEHLDDGIRLLYRGQEVHFALWPGYGLRLRELVRVCEELLGWDLAEVLGLLGGSSPASTEPGRAMIGLAALAANSPAARGVIDTGGSDVLERLRGVDPEVASAFVRFLDEHGHRPMSYDPGDTTLAERVDLVALLVRDQMDHPYDPAAAARLQTAALARARESLADHSPRDRERFEDALSAALVTYPTREDNVVLTDNIPSGLIHDAAVEIGRRLVSRGIIARPKDVMMLEVGEARSALVQGIPGVDQIVARRRRERAWVIAHPGPASYGPEPLGPPDLRGLPRGLRTLSEAVMWNMATMSATPSDSNAPGSIVGQPGSPGRYTGPARIVRDEDDFARLGRGDVLVCPITSPAWSVLFAQAGAVVTDGGGMLAHAAIIAREYGIPAVLATQDGTRRIADGDLVTVDGTAGRVDLPDKTTR